jgi:predicted permease
VLRPGIRRAFRLALRRRARLRDEVREELEHHLALSIEQLVAAGLPPHEARAEALRRLGVASTATRHPERALRDVDRQLYAAARRREDRMRIREWIEAAAHDLRYALRSARREPAFAVLVVVTLALGIGANASMFGVIDRLLLRGPTHVVDADRVLRLYATTRPPGMKEGTGSVVTYVTYTDMRDGTRSFSDVAAYTSAGSISVGRGADIQRLRRQYATWTLFPLLGVKPYLGRFFTEEEDRPPRGQPVVVLGYDAWRARFGGDPAILGRTIDVNGRPVTVVGVAPRGFTGPELEPVDLWLPVSYAQASSSPTWYTKRNTYWLQVIGRLKPGVTAAQAGADATAAHQRMYDDDTEWERAAVMSLRPLRLDDGGDEPMEVAVSRWLVGMAVVVLLIACANVANLLLARALRRRREIAVRLALGVGRARLVRLLLAEGFVLAVVGGALGLLVAYWGGQLIRVTLLPDVAWGGSPVSGRVLLFTAAATMATGVLVGLVPALRASRPNLTGALKEGTRQGGAARSPLRAALTVTQAALSVVLLVGAGLFVRSLWNVRALDLGIDTDRVLAVDWAWPREVHELPEEQRDAERTRQEQVRDRALAEIARLPGVSGVAWSIGTPFNSAMAISLRVPGYDSIPQLPGGGPYVSAVSSDYFATAGTDVVRGRAFTPADRKGSEPVTIVNRTMARTLWPDRDALGQCLVIGEDDPPCSRVVGVVEDARRFQLDEDAAMQYYVPLGQETQMSGGMLLVRPSGDAAALVPRLRSALRAIDPTLGYISAKLLQESVDPQVRPWRLGATMFAIFGGLAMLVAAVGLYSVMSYVAAQRAHEMGVRIALGAQARDIRRLILTRGLGTAAAGIGIGAVLALAGGRFLEPLLFGTSARNPAVFAVVAGALLVVALVATLVPAWRATRVDPVVTLRAE